MSFQISTQLKTAYMGVLIAEGKAVPIKGGRDAGKAEKAKLFGVGKRGGIIISIELFESVSAGTEPCQNHRF